jgi:hypothetical protein
LQLTVLRDFVQTVLQMFAFLSIINNLETFANFAFLMLKVLAVFAVMFPQVILDIGWLGLGRRQRQGQGGQGE